VAAVEVRVLVFGPLRERVGVGELHIEGRTVREVWDALVRVHPGAAASAGSIRAARNLDYCDWNTVVCDGDTVAFIPPVAGGSDDAGPVRVSVTATVIDVAAIIDSLGTSRDGAVAVFIGTVRDSSDGVAVTGIDYEAYSEMAEVEMRRIGEALQARGGITSITMVHRTGTLAVGEASVVVGVTAPHRDTAFPACQDAIAMIKRTVPVWKREHREDGARWVDARQGAGHEAGE
jgi:molybdopterin synthase catalytic subunit/molybdopterin converting factor small subunit